MLRTIIIAAATLLIHPALYAQDYTMSPTDTGQEPRQWKFRQQQLRGIDMNAAPREYEALTRRNQKILKKTFVSYTSNSLKSIGIPEQGISLVSSAVGLVTQGVRLNLNERSSLALELRDVNDSERTLYFGVTLDW
ncbi:MAG TPA: hypothetical protein VET88_15005 [Gammaproteobacteria bacterium]|nr:hypothetical protein [Gammaproteobacteria bacterium]